jgi:hypothetical protein
MEEECDDECFAVKCGLTRLGASSLVRNGIDLIAANIQRLAARASLFANHCALHNLRNGHDVSPIFTQSWWRNVITRFTESGGRCAYPEMATAFLDFETHGQIDKVPAMHYESFLSNLAKDMLTNAKTMVARQFHNLLSKSVSRIISFWALENNVKPKKGVGYAAHKYFTHLLFGSKMRSKKRAAPPVDFPVELSRRLESQVLIWKTQYTKVCAKCGKAEWIKPCHLPHILTWEHEILMDKYEYLRRVQVLKECSKKAAYGFMNKGCMKGALLLPVSSPEVKQSLSNL